jgi:hypothetical protein
MPLSDITNKTSKKREELDDFTRGMICALAVMANWKQVDLCKKSNPSTFTVHNIVKKYKEEGLKAPSLAQDVRKHFPTETGEVLLFQFVEPPPNPWGCFWAGGLGPLVTLERKVDQEKYIDCLKTNFRPWLEKIKTEYGHDFIFQEDDASCHTGAKASKLFDYWP